MSYKNQFRHTGQKADSVEALLGALDSMGKNLEREFQAIQESAGSSSATVVVRGGGGGGGGGGSTTPHNLLSATHPDTLVDSPVLGDLVFANYYPQWARLAGNTVATKKFLTQTGTGAISADPAWGAIVDADIPATLVRTSTTITIAGTSNRITSSAGAQDLSANRTWTLDISASYVGQASITTLGTIGTGVWQGTLVGVQYGGTGANLSATGGTGQYVKQSSVGAVFTVGTIPASDIASGAALSKVDDTNVTLTLGGSPTTALLAATSLTLGWTSTLSIARGGSGQATANAALNAFLPSQGAHSGEFLTTNGTDASWASSGSAAHNILSATHSDTLADTVVRGDVIVGNSTPKWSRLAVGTGFLHADGTDVGYITDANAAIAVLPVQTGNSGKFLKTDGSVASWDTPSVLAHDVLSTTHGDTLADSVVLGDLIHGNATPKWARLAGNTTTTRKFLAQTGTGVVSAAPVWDTLLSADVPGAVIVDDTTTNATMYPIWVTANSGGLPLKVSSTKMTFNPSTGLLITQALSIAGTAGAGYIDLIAQASNPSAPTAGTVRIHSSTANGFTRLEQDNEATTNLIYGRDNVFVARNTSGSAIVAGKPVYVTGSTGNVPNIALAKADSLTTLPVVGMTLDAINDNAFGQVMVLGIISSINTSAFLTGDQLWLSPATAGALVKVRPVSPFYVARVGSVLVSGVGNGSIMVDIAPFLGGLESGTTATTWLAAGVVNAVTGYQVNSLAAVGTILRGNATNYIASTSTYPDTVATGTLLCATSANVIGVTTVNATATNKFLTQSSSATPAWNTIAAADLPSSFSGLANPSASVGLAAVNGSATTAMRSDGAPALSQAIIPTWTALHIFATAARSSGVAHYHSVITPADTAMTASTESIGIQFGGTNAATPLTVIRQWAQGALTTQRENVFTAPTYAFATGASTLTNAATVAITAAPIVGTNATITNAYALWVQGGITRLDGNLSLGSATPTKKITLDSTAAHTMWIERNASTFGDALTIQGGGALVGSTDLAGGGLLLSGGISTGLGTSLVGIYAAGAAAATGTGDNTPVEVARFDCKGNAGVSPSGQLGIGVTPTSTLHLKDGFKGVGGTTYTQNSVTLQFFGGRASITAAYAGALAWGTGASTVLFSMGTISGAGAYVDKFLFREDGKMAIISGLQVGSSTMPTAAFEVATKFAVDTNGIITKINNLAVSSADVVLSSGSVAGVADGSVLSSKGVSTAPAYRTLLGTTNQIVVTTAAGSFTLSTPQDINTTSTPQFTRLGIGVAADATVLCLLQKDQNSTTYFKAVNATSGTAATSGLAMVNNTPANGVIQLHSSAYTTFGAIVGGMLSIYSDSSTGMCLMSNHATGVIVFATGGTAAKLTLNKDGNLDAVGKFTKYLNVTTVGNGVGFLVATSDLTAQGAAIGATTIYAVPAAGVGFYRISYVATVTRAATTSCVLGGALGFRVVFTDQNDSVVKTSNPTAITNFVSAINATATTVSGVVCAYCKASTNLQYLFDYTSVGATTMQYDLSIRVEYIG